MFDKNVKRAIPPEMYSLGVYLAMQKVNSNPSMADSNLGIKNQDGRHRKM